MSIQLPVNAIVKMVNDLTVKSIKRGMISTGATYTYDFGDLVIIQFNTGATHARINGCEVGQYVSSDGSSQIAEALWNKKKGIK